jgi:hypothetical protein
LVGWKPGELGHVLLSSQPPKERWDRLSNA